VHPNQVSAWKRQAKDGLGAVFSNGADKARVDREGEIHDLHAKIGQLTVERDFLARGLKR
jgi:transposase